jgi:hypothetical protein
MIRYLVTMEDIDHIDLFILYEESVSNIESAEEELKREIDKKLYNWEKWKLYKIEINITKC